MRACIIALFSCFITATAAASPCVDKPLTAEGCDVIGAITYYAAPASLTTCTYDGDGGTSCTPSDNNLCTTKAKPCATIAGAVAKFQKRVILGVVKIQLADTAADNTCFQPNGVLIDNPTVGGGKFGMFEIGFDSQTDTYPTGYVWIHGDTATPTNVILSGASTCAGTTVQGVNSAVRVTNSTLRISDMKMQYFGTTSNLVDAGMVWCQHNALCYVENITSISVSAADEKLVFGYDRSTVAIGGTFTITDMGILWVDTKSYAETRTPIGWPTITYTSNTYAHDLIEANEDSHIVGWGAYDFSFAGTGAYRIFTAFEFSSINLINGPVAGLGASITFNAANATAYTGFQRSYIHAQGATSTGNTITITALSKRSDAQSGSWLNIGGTAATAAGVGNADTTTAGGRISYGGGNVPFQQASDAIAFGNLPTSGGGSQNGQQFYCSDCTKATPCTGSGGGAIAKRLNGAWDCN